MLTQQQQQQLLQQQQNALKRNNKVGEPTDCGNGKKYYTVHGSRFEVDNRYNLIKAVGYGAYGTVCSAVDEETNTKVAIKKMSKVFDDLVDGKRILREIKVLSLLHHDNILEMKNLLSVTSEEKFEDVYMVTELMDADLYMIIKSRQKLTEEHCKYFMCQALRGLHYIHSANVLHRDLKPGNLLVNANCDLVICDFGLARGYEPVELTDYVITRWYRPPELLLMSAKYTCAVDVWSMGLIFAELLNRRTLLPGRDYINQLNLVLDVLGTPSAEDMEQMSDEAKRYIASQPPKPPANFALLFPTASPVTIDFLSRLLTFNPRKRITAKEALSHPYLERLHRPAEEPSADFQFTWDLDNSELTEPQLRGELLKEIKKWSKACPRPPKVSKPSAIASEGESPAAATTSPQTEGLSQS